MHVVVMSYEVPNTAHNAIGYVFTGILTRLLDAGHQVTCCALFESSSPEPTPEWAVRIDAVQRLGVRVIPIARDVYARRLGWGDRLRLLVRPTIADLYPWASARADVARALAAVRPDVIFIFENYQGVAATHGLTLAPRFGWFGDPYHMPALFRQQMRRHREPRSLQSVFRSILEWRRHRAMTTLLAGLDGGGAVAAHFAEWFRQHGLRDGLYLRNAVPDLGGASWRARRALHAPRTTPKIVVVGHKRGTATVAGLELLANETIPVLEERLGANGFELHVIGRYDLPAHLVQKFSRPGVRVRGFVDDIDTEFLSADVFLVPIPIALGVRTRIIFAWTYGCCVVAHSACAPGLPELRHEENALLANDGRGLAEMIVRAVRDPALRASLGERGRQTYDTWFTPAVAGGRIVEALERVSRTVDGASADTDRWQPDDVRQDLEAASRPGGR